mgnify:CR=1 FL=1
MDRLAFNAAAAITEMRVGRQMTTNELANVATPGFKRSFESAMMTLKVQGAGFESRLQPQAFASDNINMKPGVIIKTGRDLDVAIIAIVIHGCFPNPFHRISGKACAGHKGKTRR